MSAGRRKGRRRRWGPAVLGAAALLAGAGAIGWRWLDGGEEAMLRDGRTLAQVRALVDGRRACATLLSGDYPLVASEDALRADSIDALIAAGMIGLSPAPPRDERRWFALRATSAGARDMVLGKTPASLAGRLKPTPYLCYGRKQVVGLARLPAAADATLPAIAYRYRIVDMPACTRRPDMRAAFPFLDQVRAGVLQASESPMLRGGRFTLEHPIELDPAVGVDAYFRICQVERRARGASDISPTEPCGAPAEG